MTYNNSEDILKEVYKMSTHKRDRSERAFEHGHKAGIKGRSTEQCPYKSLVDLRAAWLRGWRVGRDELVSGSNPLAKTG
jgi:ribosome modulation factor